jgi:sec-independent protein translocase protein TatC
MDQGQSSGLMGFWQHLDELKARLMRCLFGFLAGFLLCYFFTDKYVFEFLQKPLFAALPPDQHKLYYTSLFENFMTHLKIAGYSSLFMLCPFYFWQLWSFIAPGLHPKERKLVMPFILSASFFFIAGGAFAYYVLFPVGFKYFIEYGLSTDVPLLTIDSYYGTCLKLMLMFGIAFELPVLMVLLGILGVINSQMLKEQRKNAIIGITVVAAFIAPPDAVSMLLLMGPMVIMYEGARIVISIFEKKRQAPKVDTPVDSNPFDGQSR